MTGFGFVFLVWLFLRYCPWIPLGATVIAVILYFILKRKKIVEAVVIALASWVTLIFLGILGILVFRPNAVHL